MTAVVVGGTFRYRAPFLCSCLTAEVRGLSYFVRQDMQLRKGITKPKCITRDTSNTFTYEDDEQLRHESPLLSSLNFEVSHTITVKLDKSYEYTPQEAGYEIDHANSREIVVIIAVEPRELGPP